MVEWDEYAAERRKVHQPDAMRMLIEKLRAGRDLNSNDINYAVTALFCEEIEDTLKHDFLTQLHRKGETADEIVGFARILRERAIVVPIDQRQLPGPLIDVCGTGGDGIDLFNVSTTIMFILAAGGAVVVKHGSRRVTSTCGSADVLEQLGVNIHLAADEMKECVERFGVGFIFARQFHPAFQAMADMRKRLDREQTRTIFSLLGPLLNPVRPRRQLLGVFSPNLTRVFGEVLRQLGYERAWIVHGRAGDSVGIDDISTSGATVIVDLANGRITSAVLDVRWLGIPESSLEDLRGGNAEVNAAILVGILSGEIGGARRDLTLVNAAGGFVVAGLAQDMNEGIARAREQIDSGRALSKLRELQLYKAKLC